MQAKELSSEDERRGGTPRRGWLGLTVQVLQHDFPSPQEVAQWCSFFFILLTLMLVAGSIFLEDTGQEILRWSKQPWAMQECELLDTGIAYVGDCPNISASANIVNRSRPMFQYRKCQVGSNETFMACIGRVKQAFDSPYAYDYEANKAAGLPITSQNLPVRRLLPRRLRIRLRMKRKGGAEVGSTEPCWNVMLPWAKVRFQTWDNHSREGCAYEYGWTASSARFDLDEAVQVIHGWIDRSNAPEGMMPSIPCWRVAFPEINPETNLGMNCDAVALEDPKTWEILFTWEAWLERHSRATMMCAAVACAACVAICQLAIFWCKSRNHGQWEHLHPTSESHESQASINFEGKGQFGKGNAHRIPILRARWGAYQDHVMSEYQLVECARGIEVAEGHDHHSGMDSERTLGIEDVD